MGRRESSEGAEPRRGGHIHLVEYIIPFQMVILMIIGTVVLAIIVALVLVIIEARVLILVFTKHQEGRTHFADKCH